MAASRNNQVGPRAGGEHDGPAGTGDTTGDAAVELRLKLPIPRSSEAVAIVDRVMEAVIQAEHSTLAGMLSAVVIEPGELTIVLQIDDPRRINCLAVAVTAIGNLFSTRTGWGVS